MSSPNNKKSEILDELNEIIALVKKNDLAELEWQQGDKRIKICRKEEIYIESQSKPFQPNQTGQPSPSLSSKSEKKQEQEIFKKILSPMVGTFYSKAKPEASPFVKVGDTVKKGQILCIIEAMKLFNEIEAEYDCKIMELVAKNSSSVEYNQTLFLVEPIN
ncbi:MAG: acetyl-CoA carboxylase biotin carboxyl carrier protein [bacterium]